MKTGVKLIFITLPLMALGVGFLAYTVSNRPPPAQNTLSERATPVRVITAAKAPLSPRITGYGLAGPSHVYEAIAQVGGATEYVNPKLKKGEFMPAGTVLLRLSQTDFNLAIAQARANIRSAEARLAELGVSQQNQIAALEIEKQALKLKENDLERLRQLVTRGAASEAAMDAVQSAWLGQRQKVLNLENAIALLPTQRQVQTEQIAVYEASLTTAELNLERTTLRVPFDARVADVSVETGQFVRIGQVAAVLDGVGSAEVEAQVSIADMIGLLRSSRPQGDTAPVAPLSFAAVLSAFGLKATVSLRLDDLVLTWPAEVDRISDTIDLKSGTVGVIVRVDTAYTAAQPGKRPPLTKGMFVEVALSGPPLSGIIVPRNAVRDGKILLAGEDNRLSSVPVTPRLVQGEVALITEGVEVGARIVVSAPSPAIDAMLLEITRDTALETRLARTEQDQ